MEKYVSYEFFISRIKSSVIVKLKLERKQNEPTIQSTYPLLSLWIKCFSAWN